MIRYQGIQLSRVKENSFLLQVSFSHALSFGNFPQASAGERRKKKKEDSIVQEHNELLAHQSAPCELTRHHLFKDTSTLGQTLIFTHLHLADKDKCGPQKMNIGKPHCLEVQLLCPLTSLTETGFKKS